MQPTFASVLLVCSVLVASAHAQEMRRWNPHYRAVTAQRTTAADHETAALRQANLRRSQIGLPALMENAQISAAAEGHSTYLAGNNLTGHYQSAGQYPQGFTGTSAGDRLTAANYPWRTYGEVISFGPATGALGVENLIEAIYHRFGLFSPAMAEAGAGYVDNHPAYGSVLTINLGNQQIPAPGSPAGWMGMYPYNGQTGVQIDFYSDQESPDPVPGANRVGYPVSLHVGYERNLTVDHFTLATASGTNLPVTLLSATADSHVPVSAAAIIPQAPLSAGQTYHASFSGRVDGVSLVQGWQFTTAATAAVTFSPANPCIPIGTTRNVFIGGGSATNVGWSNAQVINVDFVSTDQLSITALASGTATVTISLAGNSTANTTVTVSQVCPPSSVDASDRIFDWAEARYRHLFEAPGALSQTAAGYYFRYYTVTNAYLGTKDGDLWYADGYTGMMLNVGRVDAFLPAVAADGY